MDHSIQKGRMLYEGKGKKIFQVQGQDHHVILFFKDDLTAFQGRQKSSFPGKGALCKNISSLIFRYLKAEGVAVHWLKDLNYREGLCVKTGIVPLEVVIRNRLAGSTAKRLGFDEGKHIKQPLLEFYLKNDKLDDPFVSEEQVVQLELIQNVSLLPQIKERAFLINKKLSPFFKSAGLELIDFKMEFGLCEGGLLLADEISPDSCRIWDSRTGERLDKDRFRRNWPGIEEAYKTIEKKLKASNRGFGVSEGV